MVLVGCKIVSLKLPHSTTASIDYFNITNVVALLEKLDIQLHFLDGKK